MRVDEGRRLRKICATLTNTECIHLTSCRFMIQYLCANICRRLHSLLNPRYFSPIDICQGHQPNLAVTKTCKLPQLPLPLPHLVSTPQLCCHTQRIMPCTKYLPSRHSSHLCARATRSGTRVTRSCGYLPRTGGGPQVPASHTAQDIMIRGLGYVPASRDKCRVARGPPYKCPMGRVRTSCRFGRSAVCGRTTVPTAVYGCASAKIFHCPPPIFCRRFRYLFHA